MQIVPRALVIELEREVDGLDRKMGGQCLCRALQRLDALAGQLGVDPPSSFWSEDPGQAAAIYDASGVESSNFMFPPLLLFPAGDGLTSVRALAAHVRAHPDSVPDAPGVLRDLYDCERILSTAERCSVQWHFRQEFE
jgi:hypothetical protein